MNTTPYFDEIGKVVPVERLVILRAFAVIRMFFLFLALYVCVLQLFQIGFWSGTVDRALIFGGILIGLGRNSDGLEFVWRRLGPLGQLAVLAITALMIVCAVLLSGSALWSAIVFLTLSVLLATLAYGLLRMARDPLRTARYRQIKRYLRTLSKSERRREKERLERDFQTLIAEGFN